EIPDALQHGPRLDIGDRELGRQKVRRDTLSQITRLPYINHAVEAVPHEINTWLMRHFMHFLAQIRFFLSQNSHRQPSNLPRSPLSKSMVEADKLDTGSCVWRRH